MHINEGLLQAYLDGEATNAQIKIIETHLDKCIICRNKLEELQNLDQFITSKVKIYDNSLSIDSYNSKDAYQRFERKLKESKWRGLMKKMINYKKLAVGIAAVAIFTTTIFVPPVRQAAADFLHVFRVQKIETIQLNMEDLNKMQNDFMNQVGEIDLKQLGKANVISQPKFEQISLAKAQEKVPFQIKYPANLDLNHEVNVTDKNGVEFTFNTEEVNKILKQLGSKQLLPEELNGKSFTVNTQGQVDLHYRLDENNWLSLQQIASPEIIVPAGVDVFELRQILLNIPILPYDLKNKLESVNDWQNTLLVPTDKSGEIVKVQGEKGILTKNPHSSHLIWQSSGVIYTLNGPSQSDLVEIANTLRDVK
ncbi:MAG: hypothetical protein JM58_07685 [Peptococcaceae bacterium BICA1-8]|nr:MAG: hypothetical protein JM58_07685 [Peptococcaceae bacterium BICA1-8]